MPMIENHWSETAGPEITQAWHAAYEKQIAQLSLEIPNLFEGAGGAPVPITRLERLSWALEDAWRAVRLWLIRLLAGRDIDVR